MEDRSETKKPVKEDGQAGERTEPKVLILKPPWKGALSRQIGGPMDRRESPYFVR